MFECRGTTPVAYDPRVGWTAKHPVSETVFILFCFVVLLFCCFVVLFFILLLFYY